MRLPRKQKIILVITFSFGFFVAVVDVIRIAYLQEATTSREIALRQIHLQNYGGGDFACTWPSLIEYTVLSANLFRVCVTFLHVVRCGGQCLCDVRLRSQSQTACRETGSQIDPRYRWEYSNQPDRSASTTATADAHRRRNSK
jgi:hypothetical protein